MGYTPQTQFVYLTLIQALLEKDIGEVSKPWEGS